jgi:hypothetical protein
MITRVLVKPRVDCEDARVNPRYTDEMVERFGCSVRRITGSNSRNGFPHLDNMFYSWRHTWFIVLKGKPCE